jgi:hypothetical protein
VKQPATRKTPTPLPAKLPDRIELVGRALYGRRWKTRLAWALRLSRDTLHRWLTGHVPQSNVDVELMSLIAKERAAMSAHGIELDRLQLAFNRHLEDA